MGLRHLGFGLAMGLSAFVSPAMAQMPGEASAVRDTSCDRECLIGAARGYMAALAARDPKAAPLATNVTFTENNVTLPIGKGLWGTVTAVDKQGLELADPESGNAAWLGSVRENGVPAIFAVRFHVSGGQIDEVESVVHRKGALPAPFGDVTRMVHDPEFLQVLPPEQRKTRERLIAIAQSYFNTVEVNDGQVLAPFAQDCGRLENGISTTAGGGTGGNAAAIAQGCEAQFKLGIYRINKRVRERRFPLVDVERGVVLASGFFDHANEWDHYKLTDGREMRTALKWPNSITLLEAFRIRAGEISRIEAVFTYVPYFMHNPWASADHPVAVLKPDATGCDADCMTRAAKAVTQSYIAKDWPAQPWAQPVRYSDNSVKIRVGEGLWGSVTAVDDQPLVIADPKTARAVWIGRIEEHGQPSWAALTYTFSGNRISAIDTVVRRKEYGAPYAEPAVGAALAALPAGTRTPRATMAGAVQQFYAAIDRMDGKAPAGLAADCQWGVNGVVLGACAPTFTSRRLQFLEHVRDREVLAVDEARGLLVMQTFEDMPATKQDFTDASGQPFKDSATYPRTQQVIEWFAFRDGKIARVNALTSELPYGMRPAR